MFEKTCMNGLIVQDKMKLTAHSDRPYTRLTCQQEG